ncbi:hypothetical protein ANN_00709 [Periplaneta americana]|uniref:Uncharacterized protein n=1 Tax=Periplaneta americana TaxID=6978 RepID=A0ABQ8TTY5_PERAM|nr:hypothetical protein ANN_00709 [Periplaneta americana]
MAGLYLTNKKAPEEDKIHNEFIKYLGVKTRKTVLLWFNKIWMTGMIPAQWKKAVIIPILKEDGLGGIHESDADRWAILPLSLIDLHPISLMSNLISSRARSPKPSP